MLNEVVKPYIRESKPLMLGSRWLRSRLFSRRNAVPLERVHQLEATTTADRYPTVFAAAQELFAQQADRELSILSYGCSTGDECFSLRSYFPDARITGVDINPHNIAAAKSKNDDNKIEFHLNEKEMFDDGRRYDLIFALSVLCKWPESRFISDIGGMFPFGQFEEAVTELDAVLNRDGLLVIYNANFRFEEAAVAKKYDVVEMLEVQTDWVKKFSAENKELTTPYFNYFFKKSQT